MNRVHPASLVCVVLLLCSAAVEAQVPEASAIPNWPAPPTWSPHGGSGELVVMTDISFALPFVAVTPCRIADTRGNGFSGQAGPPALAANTTRTFQITGTVAGVPEQCGIPIGAAAVSFQLTVVSPSSAGNLIAWPGGAVPTISVLNWSAGEFALGNGTVIPVSNLGVLSVRINTPVGASAHLVIDVNGYYSSSLHSGNSMFVTGDQPGAALGRFINTATLTDSAGLRGEVFPFFPDDPACCLPAGVVGKGPLLGVAGVSRDRATIGVLVDSAGNLLAEGQLGKIGSSANQAYAVRGFLAPAINTLDSAAVRGDALSTTGIIYGVRGRALSDADAAAGVKGYGAYGGVTTQPPAVGFDIGVFGETMIGPAVLGLSETSGALFKRVSAANAILQESWLATAIGMDYAFLALVGDYGGTGGKYFVEPHPDDPTKVIRYVSLEGPESGTYFRGRGKFERGFATIEVPEDFRIVTDESGLGIQVTPIGQMATVAVVRIGLDRIVVQGSRDVEFFYTVNGVRRALKDHKPIAQAEDGAGEFLPPTADQRMPDFPAELKRRLIRNGTYNADGSVNMETAKRLGWDRIWAEKRRDPAPPSAIE